jgi:ribosomal protein L37E
VLLPGAGFSQGTPPPEGESKEDVAGSTPCIDNGKASRGHTRCVKCGNNKNPSAKLQCTHCGAFLREQTKAWVARRWAALKEKAKQEGRLADKVWIVDSCWKSVSVLVAIWVNCSTCDKTRQSQRILLQASMPCEGFSRVTLHLQFHRNYPETGDSKC